MQVLIVGALQEFLRDALYLLNERGYRLSYVDTAQEAIHAAQKGLKAQTVLVDVGQDIDALVTAWKKEKFPGSVVACSSGVLEKKRVRQVLESGVADFIAFPPDAHLIADIFDNFQKASAPQNKMLFQDPAMAEVIKVAKVVAQSDASVLITGESGTGKEVMANFIHQNSKRAKKVFVSVNCAAIPDTLLESELFGHEKGSFTGALQTRVGKFAEANGGTLLLDEISEMDPRLQAKLLRAIQEKKIDRIGGKSAIPVDFRLITTSNRDMKAAISEGQFREDLFFRISVVELQLPPLRERPQDLALLSKHFIEKYARENDMDNPPELSAEASRFVATYRWPGNVRQLENAMHRGVLLAGQGQIEVAHLGLEKTPPPTILGSKSQAK